MALIKCHECGTEISDQAAFCIKCDAPIIKKISVQQTEEKKDAATAGLIVFAVFIAVVIISIVLFFSKPEPETKKNYTYTATKPKKEPYQVPADIVNKQKERFELIEKLKAENVIYKITKPATFPHVYVGPAFYFLNIDQKSIFMNVVLTYYYVENSAANIVVLYDYSTGKEIGTCTPSGLNLK